MPIKPLGTTLFCYAEFFVYYTLENKSSKNCEYQPDELNDNLIENNHEKCSYPPNHEKCSYPQTMKSVLTPNHEKCSYPQTMKSVLTPKP